MMTYGLIARRVKGLLALLLFEFFFFLPGLGQFPAFAGAQGYGATARGGSRSNIYHVTNLKDSGAGSFRDGVSICGRTVVFDVSGVIALRSRVNVSSNITINGQTSPGEGITLYGQSVAFNKVHDVVVRYLRLHGGIGMRKGSCVLIADSSDRVMFDHLSVTWGRWDNVHIKGSKNVTLQYCLIGESVDPQRFGALLENPINLSIHHCLWIDNQSRNPKAKAKIELIDNVVYNWGTSGLVGGHSVANHYQDVINNYFIAGPNSSNNFLAMFTSSDHVYHKGNYADLNKDGRLNGRQVTDDDFLHAGQGAQMIATPSCFSEIPVTVEPAAKAYKDVLKSVGCSKKRDQTDRRLLEQLASLGTSGHIIHDERHILNNN